MGRGYAAAKAKRIGNQANASAQGAVASQPVTPVAQEATPQPVRQNAQALSPEDLSMVQLQRNILTNISESAILRKDRPNIEGYDKRFQLEYLDTMARLNRGLAEAARRLSKATQTGPNRKDPRFRRSAESINELRKTAERLSRIDGFKGGNRELAAELLQDARTSIFRADSLIR